MYVRVGKEKKDERTNVREREKHRAQGRERKSMRAWNRPGTNTKKKTSDNKSNRNERMERERACASESGQKSQQKYNKKRKNTKTRTKDICIEGGRLKRRKIEERKKEKVKTNGFLDRVTVSSVGKTRILKRF